MGDEKWATRNPRVGGKPTVAFVGDDETVEGLYSKIFGEDDSVKAEFVADVNDTLTENDNVRHDCIVSVVTEGDEINALREVREKDEKTPFVVIGDSPELEPSDAVEKGATDYIELPIRDERRSLIRSRLLEYAESHRSKRAERKLDSLFRHFPDQIFIHDHEGKILDVNRRACEKLGYDRDELVGMNVSELEVSAEPEQLDRLWQEYEYGEPLSLEGRHRRKDGSEFPIEVSLGEVVLEGDRHLLAITRDITDRKEREREMEKRLKAMEASMDGMAILNDDEEYVYVNQAHVDIYGYDDKGDLLGNGWRMLYEEEEVRRFEEEIFPKMAEEGEWRGEATGLRADGTRFPQELSLTSLEDGGIVCVVRDITERREREERLKEQKDRIDFFNSLLRHDLLNSMTIINAKSEMLLNELPEDDDSQELVEDIIEKSSDVADLTKRVRSVLGRLTEEDPTDLYPTDISKVVEERVETLEDGYEVDCIVNVPDTAPVVADDFLRDIVDNLLVNAVEHNDSGEPHVEVSVEPGSETTTLRVADNGPGIPDDKKETVLRQGETGAMSDGYGFGLYFVNSMVSEYGGDVRIEDNEPTGTVVVVEIPTTEDDD